MVSLSISQPCLEWAFPSSDPACHMRLSNFTRFGPDLGKRYLSQHLIRKRNKFPDQMLEKWRRTYQLNARFAEAEIASKDRTNHLWIWGKLDKRMMGVMTMLMHQNSQLCRNMERGKRLAGYTRRCQKSLQSVLENKINARHCQQLQSKMCRK